eukprot:5929251-Pleurochrysis_carterae.AAC.1
MGIFSGRQVGRLAARQTGSNSDRQQGRRQANQRGKQAVEQAGGLTGWQARWHRRSDGRDGGEQAATYGL